MKKLAIAGGLMFLFAGCGGAETPAEEAAADAEEAAEEAEEAAEDAEEAAEEAEEAAEDGEADGEDAEGEAEGEAEEAEEAAAEAPKPAPKKEVSTGGTATREEAAAPKTMTRDGGGDVKAEPAPSGPGKTMKRR